MKTHSKVRRSQVIDYLLVKASSNIFMPSFIPYVKAVSCNMLEHSQYRSVYSSNFLNMLLGICIANSLGETPSCHGALSSYPSSRTTHSLRSFGVRQHD